MPKVKREHFVPEFYLRNFASNENKIWVFDKLTKAHFETNISNVANKRSFYDFSKKEVAKGGNQQIVEDFLSWLENHLKRVLDDVLQMITTKRRITHKQKRRMSYLVAVQYMRTLEFREYLIESFEKFVKTTFAEAHNLSESDRLTLEELEFNRDVASTLHADIFLDKEIEDYVTTMLQKHIWIVGLNNCAQPFYTSDVPVVKKAHKKDPIHSTSGLESEGIEIAFPLSPRYNLILKERRFFRKLKNLDCKSKALTKKEVMYYNTLQVLQSSRQIYCPSDSFDQAEEICDKHPDACISDRTRIQVQVYPQANGTLIHFKES